MAQIVTIHQDGNTFIGAVVGNDVFVSPHQPTDIPNLQITDDYLAGCTIIEVTDYHEDKFWYNVTSSIGQSNAHGVTILNVPETLIVK